MFLGLGFTLSSYATEPTEDSESTSYGFGPAEANVLNESYIAEQLENGNYNLGPEIFIETLEEKSDLTAEEEPTGKYYNPQISSVEISALYKNYDDEWIIEVEVLGHNKVSERSATINGRWLSIDRMQYIGSRGIRFIYNLGMRYPNAAMEFIGTYQNTPMNPYTRSVTLRFYTN